MASSKSCGSKSATQSTPVTSFSRYIRKTCSAQPSRPASTSPPPNSDSGRLLTSADEIELELGKLNVAQAELDQQKALQDLAAAQMVAPVSGSVLTLDAAPGTKVSSGTVVATLADPSRLELTVQVAEVDIPRIERGRPVDIVIDAFPDQTFAGEISRIDPFNQTQSGAISYPVTIRLLDNALDSLYCRA